MYEEKILIFFFAIIFGLLISYLSFLISSSFLKGLSLIYWAVTLGNFTKMTFGYATLNSEGHSQIRLDGIQIVIASVFLIINLIAVYYLFMRSGWKFVILFIFPYIGLETGLSMSRSILLEKSGQKVTVSENIKSHLVAEIWFILLLIILKCAQLFM